MKKEDVKKTFKALNLRLPKTQEDEHASKYHFRDILRVLEYTEQQINLSLGGVVCSDLSDDHAITILENCPFEESGYCNTELKCRFKLDSGDKDDNGCELCL